MKELVIDISAGGVVESLHMDEFPLSFLGPMAIERASTIEFHETSQTFYVCLTKAVTTTPPSNYEEIPLAARGFAGYDTARRFEVEWLNACRKQGTDPMTLEGIEIADTVRLQTIFA